MPLIRPIDVWVVNDYNEFFRTFFDVDFVDNLEGKNGKDQEMIEEMIGRLTDGEYTCLFIKDENGGYFIIQKYKNLYWSIYDHSNYRHLEAGINSKRKRDCLEAYFQYRKNDLWFWDFGRMSDKMFSEEHILEDMDTCNYELKSYNEKLDENE